MAIQFKISKKMFNDVYYPQLKNYDTRFNIYYGGAGSGKSKFVVQKMILKYLTYQNRKCLVIRKISNTLRDSIFAEFKTVIADWGLYDKCVIRNTLLTIEFPNGSQILFKGLDDPEKIKSISGIDDIVIEEATDIDQMDYSQLNLRLRSKNPFNQIHIMFNPVSKSNWVYKMWFANPSLEHKNTMIMKTTYKDNRFLPADYVESLEEYKITNPIYYRIYALGEFASLEKLVYTNWEEKQFDYREILRGRENSQALFGLDFGYINDPSAFVALVVDKDKKEIFIFDEFYKKGLLNDEIAAEIKSKGYAKEEITADSAEQKSIEEIRRLNIPRIKGAKKGLIIIGIQAIQQYKMFVHPNCINVIEELKNYAWQKDKRTGEYINKPIDTFNHALDALRYACERLQKPKRKLRSFKIPGI
ncbi:PBSX family phage terminase large subunit [uncultured Clostridium sp.]|uniref:PBSX family phage terminase large subunit n=1 Tax=uncultured Clostridium sp. TaxID=59620 RepID=UPI0026211DF6|nr:PBSX family phage terminase large subunit [uncultured Clostridium sp.]